MKNCLKKICNFVSGMKVKALLLLGLMTCAVAKAEGEQTPDYQVDELWGKLGLDFGKFFEQVFDAMKTPVGSILAVVFVMAVFYFCVKMAKSAINKRNSI